LGSYAGGSWQQLATSSLGLLTTNVAEGSNLYYLDSRVQSFVHASTTIPKTYTSNTFTNTNTFSNTVTFGSGTTATVNGGMTFNFVTGGLTLSGYNGPLDTRNGIVGATTSIGVLYGGTGLTSAPSYGNILVGNSSNGYTLTATSSLGLITAALTSIGPTGQTTTGPTVTLATTTSTTNGITSALNIVGSGSTMTFTPSQSGTLAAGGGGTGINNPTAAGVLLGSYVGGSYQQLATSSLGLITTNVAEGSNQYFTDGRAQSATGFVKSGSNVILNTISDNVGLGTTSPYTKLGVVGEIVARNITATSTTATSSFTSLLASQDIRFSALTSCDTIDTDLNGFLKCGTDAGAGGGISFLNGLNAATQTFATSSDTNITLSIVSSGSTHTFNPGWTGTLAASRGGTGISNPTAAGILLGSYGGGSYQQLATSSLGLNTTDIIEGNNLYYTDARVNTYINGSSTIPKTYTNNTFTNANTFSGALTANGGLTIGSLNGPLQANAGVVSATTSIGVLYGGTGLTSAPSYGNILVGNSAGGYTLTATSSLGLITAALTSIGPTGQTTTGPTVTLATTTSTTNGITSALNIVGSGSTMTFTPSQSGTLTAGGGGTGISNPTAAGVLVGSYAGGSYQQIATSSLGLLTTNVAEGNSLYYTDVRVNTYINASTTIPKTYTSNTFTNTNTFSGLLTANGGLTIGSLNGPLDARNGVVGATTSIGVLYGGTGLTSAPSYGNILVGNSAGGYTLTATSSLGLPTSAITSLGAQYSTALTGSAQTFATTSDTNIGLVITSSGSTHTFTPTFTGTLADSRVADNLTISGGIINNTPIGASTASTGIFTDATSTNATTTHLAVSGTSQLGTVTSGTWNGSTITAGFGGTGIANPICSWSIARFICWRCMAAVSHFVIRYCHFRYNRNTGS
jgi:hypothetical protein